MELHPMTPAERPALRGLYRRAFPLCEQKPWSYLERLQREGRCEILTIDDEGFGGLMITLTTPELVMLDFFAVDPSRRNRGLGAAALDALRARCAGRPICLEIEDPEEPGAANTEQRTHRKGFYLRCGLMSVAKIHIYETDMELLATEPTVRYGDYRALMKRVLGSPFVEENLTEY